MRGEAVCLACTYREICLADGTLMPTCNWHQRRDMYLGKRLLHMHGVASLATAQNPNRPHFSQRAQSLYNMCMESELDNILFAVP